MAETDLMREILVAVSAVRGAIFWRQNVGTYRTMDGKRIVKVAPAGIGDLMGGYRGRAVAIEVKTRTGGLSESQERFRDAWVRAGNTYIVVRSPNEATEALRALDPA